MIDIKLLRNNPDEVKRKISLRGVDPELVDNFLDIDGQWRKVSFHLDELRAKHNILSEEIAKKSSAKDSLFSEAKELKSKIEENEKIFKDLENQREKSLIKFPNLPLNDVPSDKEGEILKEGWGKPKFNFSPKSYLELAERYDLVDLERASKVAGNRFSYLKKEAALLEIALINFAFDFLVNKNSFIPIFPPVMLKPEIMKGMGYLDQAPEEIYFLPEDELFLAGTAEHPLVAMHADEIFNEDDLPKRYVAFSTCFRREAGSYGRDVKGIMRVHQFDKIEMVSFVKPEDSEKEQEFILNLEEKLVKNLQIPYQIRKLGAEDLGFPSAKTYDIECWLPSEGIYRETHSCSNCTDFQARRLNIKYKSKTSPKTEYVHTLNGTGLAIGRTLIAVLENYQTEEGTVVVPEALRQYVKFKIIE